MAWIAAARSEHGGPEARAQGYASCREALPQLTRSYSASYRTLRRGRVFAPNAFVLTVYRAPLTTGDFKVQSDVIYAFQLVEQRGKILGTKPENWDQQEQSRFTIDLSDNDVGLLLDFEDGSDEDRRTLLQEQDGGQRLAAIFLKLVENVGSVGIKYFLARIDEILSENRRAARYFHECKDPFGRLGLSASRARKTTTRTSSVHACMPHSLVSVRCAREMVSAGAAGVEEGQTRLKNMIDQPLSDFIFILNERARSKSNLIPLKALKDTLKLERALSRSSATQESGCSRRSWNLGFAGAGHVLGRVLHMDSVVQRAHAARD